MAADPSDLVPETAAELSVTAAKDAATGALVSRTYAGADRDGQPEHPNPKGTAKRKPLPPSQIPLHVIRVGIRAALLGYGMRAGVAFLIKLVAVVKGKTTLRDALVLTLTAKAMRQFAYFLGSFAALWKGTNSVLRLIRGRDDKLNGFVAGAVAGLALGFEEKSRRVAIAQQLLVRGCRAALHGMKKRNIFHVPHGDSLVFAFASAQIMYAWRPIPPPVLDLVRQNVRNEPIDVAGAVATVASYGATPRNLAITAALSSTPNILPCAVLHPWTDYCNWNFAWVFQRVFKKILPVYVSLTVVPMVLLKMKDFLRKPYEMTRHALFNAGRSTVFFASFVSGYQFLSCRYRDLVEAGFIPRDSRFAYWSFGFLTSGSIFIESKQRRPELAIYVVPRGVESLYEVMRGKGLAPKIKYFEIFMFSMGMGMIISFFQTEPDAIGGILLRALKRFDVAIEDKRPEDARGANVEAKVVDAVRKGTEVLEALPKVSSLSKGQ
ncbi:hypothetical protein HKX48_008862 [Thoreauomyces humboldtii]|nr:hypothetical protein HKX48_008862 [Thoreauomyces humboldtii]